MFKNNNWLINIDIWFFRIISTFFSAKIHKTNIYQFASRKWYEEYIFYFSWNIWDKTLPIEWLVIVEFDLLLECDVKTFGRLLLLVLLLVRLRQVVVRVNGQLKEKIIYNFYLIFLFKFVIVWKVDFDFRCCSNIRYF